MAYGNHSPYKTHIHTHVAPENTYTYVVPKKHIFTHIVPAKYKYTYTHLLPHQLSLALTQWHVLQLEVGQPDDIPMSPPVSTGVPRHLQGQTLWLPGQVPLADRPSQPSTPTWNKEMKGSPSKVLASLSNKQVRNHHLLLFSFFLFFLSSPSLFFTHHFTTCILDTYTHQCISHPSSFQLLYQITLIPEPPHKYLRKSHIHNRLT